ncbi:MAG: hypothetical protein RLZZ453_256 [Chlamydiota bacterium]|jgi:D-lactate dehydrogenase
MNIAFFNTKSYEKEFFEKENKAFGFTIKYFDISLNSDTCNLAAGYDVVCVFVNDILSKDVIEILIKHGVKLIALRCAGYNNVDLSAAEGKIAVVHVPAYSPHAVAEHALALMLCLNRKLHKAFYRTRDNNFSIAGLMGFDMHKKTAGIIGCGQIGACLIPILKGLGMQVLGYDVVPSLPEKAGATSVDLDTLYKNSDVISLHCSLSKTNKHLISEDALQKMKTGVMLINTGRGALIDHTALIQALKSGKVGAVGLDVYEEESNIFYKDLSESFISDDILARLQTFPNVLITAHQAFFTKEAMHNIALTTLENICAYKEQRTLKNQVSR